MKLPRLAPRLTVTAALACAWMPVHGCSSVDGGAVEVSWNLLSFAGNRVECDAANVTHMQLWWQVGGTRRYDAFPCDDNRGVTVFDLPVGTADLWLQPQCRDDHDPVDGSWRAPAPIVRTITEGDVITLDTQLVEVRVTCAGDEECACP